MIACVGAGVALVNAKLEREQLIRLDIRKS